jgi:hypothetical protein
MYIIEPYKSINNLNLNSTPAEIEQILGKCDLEKNEYAPDYLTGFYQGGIIISYKDNLACYIGILIGLCPAHLEFNFLNKNYNDVMNYFKQYPGNIYIEEDVIILSDHLGISTYFEDGLKEVAIFLESYRAEIIKHYKLMS